MIPGDGVRPVVENVVALVSVGDGSGSIQRAQVHLVGGLDRNRRIAVARHADHRMVRVHPDLQARLAAGISCREENAACCEVEGLVERLTGGERVRCEFHPHTTELDVGVAFALGIRATDVEQQVAIALGPDVERGFAIAERHRLPGVGARGGPDFVVIRQGSRRRWWNHDFADRKIIEHEAEVGIGGYAKGVRGGGRGEVQCLQRVVDVGVAAANRREFGEGDVLCSRSAAGIHAGGE